YIANHSSLLEFDGNNWNTYKLPSASIIRSVKAVGDRIYTGSYREFGFWKAGGTGQLSYTSLSDRLDSPLSEDEAFWDILVLEQWVLFQSLDRSYIFDLQQESFRILEAPSAKAKLHRVGDKVYFQRARQGLFTIEKGEPVLVDSGPALSDRPLIGLYGHEGELLAIREDARFFRYGRHGPLPFKTDMDSVEVSLYSS